MEIVTPSNNPSDPNYVDKAALETHLGHPVTFGACTMDLDRHSVCMVRCKANYRLRR